MILLMLKVEEKTWSQLNHSGNKYFINEHQLDAGRDDQPAFIQTQVLVMTVPGGDLFQVVITLFQVVITLFHDYTVPGGLHCSRW